MMPFGKFKRYVWKCVLVLVLAFRLNQGTLGFVPRVQHNAVGHKSRFKTTRVCASTLNGETKVNDQSEDAAKQSGIKALQQLLKRQQSEMEETRRLLELYESSADGNSTPLDVFNGENRTELMSIASSVLMGFDYGFKSRSEGPTFDYLKGGDAVFIGYGPPANLFAIGKQQFMRNLNAMRNEYEDEKDTDDLSPKQLQLQEKLTQLTLNSTAIWERELKDGPIEAPLLIKIPYLFLCWMLDAVFEGKYVPARFFLLETVARMPYFSYISMLHLYETLGFWRRSADIKRIHFAEELNEFRHLLIMESYGGDQLWWVRFMAQHSALAYYIGLCILFCISPSLSYKFSELLETHAVNTYSQFLDENEELLQELPPSLAAVDYYALGASDPYYAEFQTTAISSNSELRKPGLQMENMYHVFSAIRDDEGDHVSTMKACLDPSVAKLSPSLERKVLTGIAAAAAVAIFLNTGADIGVGSDLADNVDMNTLDAMADIVVDEGSAYGILDAILAGAAALLPGFGTRDEEGSLARSVVAGDGLLPELPVILSEIAAILTRFL